VVTPDPNVDDEGPVTDQNGWTQSDRLFMKYYTIIRWVDKNITKTLETLIGR
jgi:hypothetical protein